MSRKQMNVTVSNSSYSISEEYDYITKYIKGFRQSLKLMTMDYVSKSITNLEMIPNGRTVNVVQEEEKK